MTPTSLFNLSLFTQYICDARGVTGLRETARLIGISAATLHRTERGYMPSVETFLRVCRWLRVDPGTFLLARPEQTSGKMSAWQLPSRHDAQGDDV